MKSPREYRRAAAYRACVDVYAAGSCTSTSVRYYWPYKLARIDELSNPGRFKSTCDVVILDSGIGNDDITNEQVIETATEIQADYVIPKDYAAAVSDVSKREARELTTESVREFIDLYEQSDCKSRYLVPLQPPYHKHYRELPDEWGYVLGGMKRRRPKKKLRQIRKFREVAGYDVYAHGLGMGASRLLIDTFRNEPDLLDSMDTSTPEYGPTFGYVPDREMDPNRDEPFSLPGGDDMTTGQAIAAELILWEIAHMLNPEWTPPEGEQATSTRLGDFG